MQTTLLRVICACAVDTRDGEVDSEGYERPAQLERHLDIRAWYLIPQATTNSVRNAVRCPLRDAVAYVVSPKAIERLGATRRA